MKEGDVMTGRLLEGKNCIIGNDVLIEKMYAFDIMLYLNMMYV